MLPFIRHEEVFIDIDMLFPSQQLFFFSKQMGNTHTMGQRVDSIVNILIEIIIIQKVYLP